MKWPSDDNLLLHVAASQEENTLARRHDDGYALINECIVFLVYNINL